MHECNPVTSPVRTAPALWRGAAPSVNWERRSAAAARNWSASWKAAARRETASPRTPGNYFQQAPKNPPQVALSTLEPRGTGPPAPFSFGGWRTNQKNKNKRGDWLCFAAGEVVWLLKLCLHMKWWRLLLARTCSTFQPHWFTFLLSHWLCTVSDFWCFSLVVSDC